MSPRRRRIERILEHRRKELDERAVTLAAARAREAAAIAEAEAAQTRARAAQEARRQLAQQGSDVMSFIEAEDWLATTARHAERAWASAASLRNETLRVQ